MIFKFISYAFCVIFIYCILVNASKFIQTNDERHLQRILILAFVTWFFAWMGGV